MKQLFQMTKRLITDQTEITGFTTLDWKLPMWNERAVQFATAKTYVFSDLVLCLGGISDEPVEAWESMIKWFSNKGTGGMECSVVLFKPRIHLFACTLPSVSNSLDCNYWLAYKHVCVRASVYSPLTNHVWILGPCLGTSICLLLP